MSIATAAAALLNEAGVGAAEILREAGVDREGAIRQIASELGVDLQELVSPTDMFGGRGQPVEITESDVAQVRAGLEVLNRTFQ
jgi:hypothetical protein